MLVIWLLCYVFRNCRRTSFRFTPSLVLSELIKFKNTVEKHNHGWNRADEIGLYSCTILYVHHPIFMGYSKIFSYSCMGIEEVYFNLHHPKKTWNRTLELLDLEDEWQGAHCNKIFKFLWKIFHNDTPQIWELIGVCSRVLRFGLTKWMYSLAFKFNDQRMFLGLDDNMSCLLH